MRDEEKTKRQLIDELAELRQRLAACEPVAADAGDGKLAEERLRQERNRAQQYLDVAAVIMMVLDNEGKITLLNQKGYEILGYQEGDLFGQDWFGTCVPERVRSEVRGVFRQLIAGLLEPVEYGENPLVTRSGEERTIAWHNALLTDDSGRITGTLSSGADITERKRAEEALKKAHGELERQVAETRLNEARLEAVLQLSHMTEASLQEITDFALEQAVVLTKSKIGYLAFMNEDETVLTMHSWSKEAMAECAISNKPLVYPLETTGLWGEAVRQRKSIVTNDYAAPNPLKKGLPEGHVGIGRHMNVPILDGGHIVIVAGVGNKDEDYDESDVRQLTLLMEGMWMLIQRQRAQTELRQYRDHLEQLVEERTEALREVQGKLQAIYDGMADGLLIADIETKQFVRANASICRMLGYSEAELLSRSVRDIHPAAELPGVLEGFQALADGRLGMAQDFPVLRRDGTVFFANISTSTIVYNGRRCLIGFFRDITERKQAQVALEQQHRTVKLLLQASDHERRLIAYDIHDGLAQLLAGAIMQFQIYEHARDAHPDQAAKAYQGGVALLRQGHSEARRIISGVRPPILDESGVLAAVAHLVHDPNVQQGPKIDFHSRAQFDRLPPILENAIYRIVQEGLTNARKHSQSQKVRVSLVQRGDRVRIEIRDWGIGFDLKAVKENRFGLAGIRERARLLGGKCGIHSTLGEGTSIVVELPLILKEE